MTPRRFPGYARMERQSGQATARLLLGLALLVGLLLPAMAGANIGRNSCASGTDPCVNNSGDVKNNACNGDYTCVGNTGNITDNACNGYHTCDGNSGATIGNSSCVTDFACLGNMGPVGG